jgi:predicted enzyme related to lactoylglutathione lyase
MSASFAAVVLNTRDPIRHAAFYRELLGWITVDEAPDWVRLRHPDTERPSLSFQLDPDDRAPAWPSSPDGEKLQAHLDVLVDDLEAEVARAVALGATVEQPQPSSDVTVLRDPCGHIFCLFLPGA